MPQKRAGVALRTFPAPEYEPERERVVIGCDAELESLHLLTRKFRTRRSNMFITRPHFGLCLSPLTVSHHHIPPSLRPSRSPSEKNNCNAGIKSTTYVKSLTFNFWGSVPPPLAILRTLHLTDLLNSRTTPREQAYRLSTNLHILSLGGTPKRRRTRTRQFGTCHPGRNTNVIRVSPP